MFERASKRDAGWWDDPLKRMKEKEGIRPRGVGYVYLLTVEGRMNIVDLMPLVRKNNTGSLMIFILSLSVLLFLL